LTEGIGFLASCNYRRRVAADLDLQARGGGARWRESVSWRGATGLGAWRLLVSPAAAPVAGGMPEPEPDLRRDPIAFQFST
jgi:hypothetical protein